MSLLTNPWFNVGMGLLANSGPSLTPVNPWRGIGQGLMAASDAKAMEAQQAYESQRMAMEQQKMAQEQQRQQMLQQWAQTQPDPQGAALFPEKAYELANTAGGEGVEIRTAGELGMTGFDPNTPVEVTMKGGRPTNYTPMTPPAPQTSGIQLQGPGGEPIIAESVPAAQAIIAKNPGVRFYKPPPSIAVSGAEPVASVSDAANLRYPDGSRVIAGTPMSTIYERGAVSITQADSTEAVTDVNIKGYDASLRKAGIALKDANAAYKENPTADNYQRLKAARSSAATALAQRRNTKGEPSGEVVREAEANLPLPFSVGGAMGAALGADPIDAALQEVDSLYGLGIYAPAEKPQAKPKTDGTSVFDMYPGLRK